VHGEVMSGVLLLLGRQVVGDVEEGEQDEQAEVRWLAARGGGPCRRCPAPRCRWGTVTA
jgi:hypothetical protein